MSGSNAKTWTAGELMQHVECDIAEAEQAIATLGATASKDALVAAVRAIRRRKAEALFDQEEAERIAQAPEEPDGATGESFRP